MDELVQRLREHAQGEELFGFDGLRDEDDPLISAAGALAERERLAATPTLQEPQPPNESGETFCGVRWMVETPAGWLGSYDKEAFRAYGEACVAAERERINALLVAIREHWLKANGEESLSVAALDVIAEVIADGSYVRSPDPTLVQKALDTLL